jgi:hypothetical protein
VRRTRVAELQAPRLVAQAGLNRSVRSRRPHPLQATERIYATKGVPRGGRGDRETAGRGTRFLTRSIRCALLWGPGEIRQLVIDFLKLRLQFRFVALSIAYLFGVDRDRDLGVELSPDRFHDGFLSLGELGDGPIAALGLLTHLLG